jgi:hypothetical protein
MMVLISARFLDFMNKGKFENFELSSLLCVVYGLGLECLCKACVLEGFVPTWWHY